MNHMSLGFVNDTNRGRKDTLQSNRQQSVRPRPQVQPMVAVPEDAPTAGVVPVIDNKPAPPQAEPALPPHSKEIQMPSDRNTLERRLEFVSGQVRELYETVTFLQGASRAADGQMAQKLQQVNSRLEDVAQRAVHAANVPGLLTIRGECLVETPQFEDRSGGVGQQVAPIAVGTPLVLAYPMTDSGPTSGAVYMRRMNVDPSTATVSWTWVQLYANGRDEQAYVGNFSP